jgi:Uma2 family endonuclease
MSGPSRTHQKISWYLSGTFFNYLKGKPCEAYAAPFDVRLYNRTKSVRADRDVYTVVQPDLCIVCDLKKLDERGCLGAPDLMVEILSPGNAAREMKTKKSLYAESGVREYWIISPAYETITRYNLETDEDFGRPLIFVRDEMMPSLIFPDLQLNLNEVFPHEDDTNEPSQFFEEHL